MEVEREVMEQDVLLVGAGAANLSCAIKLMQLVAKHNESAETKLEPQVSIIEKAPEIGHHQLSGAVMDPRGMAELFPDWREQGCPIEAPVARDAMMKLSATKARKLKIVPPSLHNTGKFVVSLNKIVKWLATKAEAAGVNIFPGFPGADVLYEDNRVKGVRVRDMGVDKWGEPKDGEFMPGGDLVAKVTVLGEGTRGSLAKHLIPKLGLDKGRNPQIYQIGVKEVWKLSEAGQKLLKPGDVYHTMKHPMPKGVFGGGWVYGMADGMASIGFVVGLDYKDPTLDPHQLFQKYKQHPWVKAMLDGGEILHYGAKTIPDGGYFSVPKLSADGVLLVGDTAGFMNSMRLKGIHLAIKSGILAAETIFECLKSGDFSANALHKYQNRWESSWAKAEMWGVRNFRQAYQRGETYGFLNTAVGLITGGRGLSSRLSVHADYKEYNRVPKPGTTPAQPASQYDDKLTFDKLKDVYYSGSTHEENQPCHLQVIQPDVCVTKCTQEYGNPCQHFCPAKVYEMVPKDEGKGMSPQLDRDGQGQANAQGLVLKINASNCVHCKTCDIKDPYQVINWVVPEGGGGPIYTNM
ncbi:MAG: electron transfer flavoprotein-ubiquinone oxidoreductase [Planctomycetes bacterium]|nr:electron transfer flavoprotein-ubiquinone oxidoreductase [Planctomycetota bacterium]MCW8135441.1 electron transfer flavoprotein-ubiquinone oxidoreductase [Planctomycetota bacterium]